MSNQKTGMPFFRISWINMELDICTNIFVPGVAADTKILWTFSSMATCPGVMAIWIVGQKSTYSKEINNYCTHFVNKHSAELSKSAKISLSKSIWICIPFLETLQPILPYLAFCLRYFLCHILLHYSSIFWLLPNCSFGLPNAKQSNHLFCAWN